MARCSLLLLLLVMFASFHLGSAAPVFNGSMTLGDLHFHGDVEDPNSTIQYISETVIHIPPPPDLTDDSLQHASRFQTFVDSGTQYLEPLVSFLQGLFARPPPAAGAPAPFRGFEDRRKLYIV